MNAEFEEELIRLSAMTLATEDWSKQYSKSPTQHAVLIKNNAKLLVLLTKYYRSMANSAEDFVNWQHYNYQVSQGKPAGQLSRETLDYDVSVIVNDNIIDSWDDAFIKLTLQTVTNIAAAGAKAGEEIYKVPLGIQGTDAAIQKLGTQQVAKLVGKSVQKDGKIVDNPDPDYNVGSTVRNDIAQSVKTSLALGEDKAAAIKRMQTVISNPARAERISNTESVNAFNKGTMEFADQSNAVGKEWEDAGSEDECADNAAQGPIGIDESFDSGDDEPTAHPNCRCAVRLVYQKEWDANDYGNGSGGNTRPTGIDPGDMAG